MKHLSILFLFIVGFTSCEGYKTKLIEKRSCVVTSVETFSPGQRHTLQVDYEWRATTNCGTSFTSKRPVAVGDTIQFEYHKFLK